MLQIIKCLHLKSKFFEQLQRGSNSFYEAELFSAIALSKLKKFVFLFPDFKWIIVVSFILGTFWSCFTLIYCIILSVLEEFGDANEIWIKHLWSLQKSDSNVECYFKYLVQFFYFGFLQIFEQVLSEMEPLCLAEQDFISKFFKLQQHQSMPGTVVWLLLFIA